MESADIQDLKSCGSNLVWVQIPSPVPIKGAEYDT